MAEGRKTRKKQETDLKGNVSGWHVYKDERGRAVYYDVFSKTGYILANNEDRYKQFSMRFVLGAIGFILMLMCPLFFSMRATRSSSSFPAS